MGLSIFKGFKISQAIRLSTKDPSNNTQIVAEFQPIHYLAPLGFSSPDSVLVPLKPKAPEHSREFAAQLWLFIQLPAALVAAFWLVCGDQGSSLGLVSRYTLSLSWVGTVIFVLSTFCPFFLIEALRYHS